ncbi:MAG: hypothetical protein ACI8V2_003450 [Candidatus Latescibacterota bacterium]|jgi:hypothetical protein
MMAMEVINITYTFNFPDGHQETFVVNLDPETVEVTDPLPENLPEWTRLDFHKCAHCPLDSETHPHCPLSARIAGIVDRFTQIISYEEMVVEVQTPERTVSKDTTAQQGLSALMGLVMATSGCPITALFKPMAAFHLPFANSDETTYRAASMYLLAQYYLNREVGKVDLSMRGLEDFYRSIEVLNEHMAKRVRAATERDAAINALVELDFFAKNFTFGLEDRLEELKYVFQPYLDRFEAGNE